MTIIWISLGAVFLTFILTYLFRKIAVKISIMDVPNDRSSHVIPTPRGGGIAIAVVWFVGIFLLHKNGTINSELFYALLSGLILVIISLLDDIFTISYSIRLIFQIISISVGIYFLGGMEIIDFGFFHLEQTVLLSLLSGIALLWFINLYNFIDGIDGYAATEAIFLSAAIFLLCGNYVVLLLGGATLGYLYWNFGKKKIFLGDIGSTLLGYTLGILALYENNQENLPILIFVILSSLFWFDATLTLFRRAKNREKLTEAHKKHAYQRLVQGGFSHQKTVLYSIGVNLILFGIAYLSMIYYSMVLPFLGINLIFLYLMVRKVDKVKPFS